MQPAAGIDVKKNFRVLFANQESCRWLGTDHCYQTEALKGESATDFVLGKYSHIGKQIRIRSPPKLFPVLLATSKGIFSLLKCLSVVDRKSVV